MEEKEQKKNLPTIQKMERELVQSYILTFARYNFDVYEKRIMYYVLKSKKIQDYVREQIQNLKENKKKTPFQGMEECVIPISELVIHKGEYERYKEAFKNLCNKGFEIEDKERGFWAYRSFLANPTIDMFDSYVSGYVHSDFIKVLAAIEHGYRQFDFNIAFNLKSAYSMRFYEMISRQDKGQYNGYFTRSIEELKETFGLGDKYGNTTMFIKRVIEPAKRELDECANYSFDYKLQKGDVAKKSRKKDEIQFHIYHIPENETNDKLKENRVMAEMGKYIRLSPQFYEFLLKDTGIPESSINSNIYTLYIIEQTYWRREGKNRGFASLVSKIDELKERALRTDRDNWIAYIIGALKRIEKIDHEKERAEKIALFNIQLEQGKKEQEIANEPENKTEP